MHTTLFFFNAKLSGSQTTGISLQFYLPAFLFFSFGCQGSKLRSQALASQALYLELHGWVSPTCFPVWRAEAIAWQGEGELGVSLSHCA